MTVLGETQARIASIRKLKTVVGAMRGIAATHAQQARESLKGYRAYTQVIADGLGRAIELLQPTATGGPPSVTGGAGALVVFTAEHGLAGAFSEHVLESLHDAEAAQLFVVGARGLALIEQRGWRAAWSAPMSSQASGVGATARRVADALYAGFVAGRFSRVEIAFAKLSGAGGSDVVRRTILPVDLGAFRKPSRGPAPIVNLAPQRLVEQLVGEYVFAELALAALESFAAENTARLTTMESARLNIEQKLDELSVQERLQRQEQITAEVQEVTSGALASEPLGAR